ncbi:hypothetical protein HPO96_25425 [Kribbella sandramycini]|uniref:DUF1707 domain-containing protein n=1 Tax=Kribbella sandramycini TaxID=60450 RepID=A0A7Y4P0W2_9ACTN|nr:hypothetical protein [Kribbella sandramycini]MBB6570999.1 hypothetical protein [Kribbella sandramycini]NOL43592.1 hypothetical protein [Kribbella sandramycini]
MTTVLDPLLLPDQVELSDADRVSAAGKIDHVARLGRISPSGAIARRELLGQVRTRGELREVFAGLDDAVPPRGLTNALRVATAVWLVACVVQFVVWTSLAFFGHFDWPWWLWSDLGLGMVVGILWWTHESYHRRRTVAVTR